MNDHTDTAVAMAVLIFALALILWGMYTYIEDQKQWDAFAHEHNCKVVEVKTPHTAYECDDGVTYWRKGKSRNYTGEQR